MIRFHIPCISLSGWFAALDPTSSETPIPTHQKRQTKAGAIGGTGASSKFSETSPVNVSGKAMIRPASDTCLGWPSRPSTNRKRTETFDAGSNIRHHFRGEFYANSTDADMTYPLDYLNANGVTTALAPKSSDLTRLDLRYSNKPKEALRYDMYNQRPLADRDNEISLSVRYDF